MQPWIERERSKHRVMTAAEYKAWCKLGAAPRVVNLGVQPALSNQIWRSLEWLRQHIFKE